MILKDKGDYIGALLYLYFAAIAGLGGPPKLGSGPVGKRAQGLYD